MRLVLEVLRYLFSCAADIVNGTQPMRAARRLSVRSQPFFKSNGLPRFSSDLSDIWLECAQQYYPKSYGYIILIFAIFYSLDKFPLDSPENSFMSSSELLFRVCKIWGVVFRPPNESKFRFSIILLKSFLWIYINLALYAHWSYFQTCVIYGPQTPNFGAIIWAPK